MLKPGQAGQEGPASPLDVVPANTFIKNSGFVPCQSARASIPIQTMNRSHFAFTRHAPRAQGFSLVEMAMVLLVVGVLAALFPPPTP